MRGDRQIAACNSTIICQRKQFPLERCQVWVFYNHRRTIITSLIIQIKPGKSDWMSQTSHVQSDTQSIIFLVKVNQNRNRETVLGGELYLGCPLCLQVCVFVLTCTICRYVRHLVNRSCRYFSLCVYL